MGLQPGGRFEQWARPAIAHVALDVDGTLVGTQDDVPSSAVEAIEHVLRQGVSVGYATGRMHSALDGVDAQVHLPGPHIVHNGALVRHNAATAASWPLSEDDIAALVAIASNLDAYAELYLDEGFLVTRRDPRAEIHWELLGQPPIGLADDRGSNAVIKATFIAFAPHDTDPIVDAILEAGMDAGPAGSLLTPGLTYVNATRKGVNKGAALDEAASLADTSIEHVLAIGDGGNDLEMLSVAGTAVAMGQASDRVKAAAHLVTTHVDEDGLALALRSLVS